MNEPGRAKLTESEHEALKELAEAYPEMPDIRRGYMLGYAEAVADQKGNRKPDRPAFAEEK